MRRDASTKGVRKTVSLLGGEGRGKKRKKDGGDSSPMLKGGLERTCLAMGKDKKETRATPSSIFEKGGEGREASMVKKPLFSAC